MVGSSLTSLLARSGVSLDFDLASVCQEMNSRQQHDEKTPEGYYMLWRCYSSRRGVNARISKPGAHDLSTPLMSLASSISLGQVFHIIRIWKTLMNIQVGLSCTTLRRHQLEVEGLGADNLILGRGAFGTVVLGKWYGAKASLLVN